MTLTMDNFQARYGEAINAAEAMQEWDKGLDLIENLFLLEDIESECKIALATMAAIFQGHKLKAVLRRGMQLSASMNLTQFEKDAMQAAVDAYAKGEGEDAKVN